jgi:hypothetical protein
MVYFESLLRYGNRLIMLRPTLSRLGKASIYNA